ncbi:RDD family protein [Bacteriovorax sp. Seq25_V]|uniref:RDD family protein n=1 Tax=Bacteriovorax sp. Seq25_V TaxID=1201288 RepID=UPI000389DEAF|nr:RDD family protein [Bacteriovorax sp. Seq25_V]EQC43490.1 RDD family protein [Bacteriovorax sp. Seq25_V]
MLDTNINDKKIEVVDFDLDAFDIEDIPFKPINEGLGFHHNGQAQKNELHIHKKVYDQVIQKPAVEERAIPSELKAFYSQTTTASPKVNKEIKIFEKVEKDATKVSRLMAFITDVIIVLMLVSVIFSLMFISTTMTISDFVSQLMLTSNIVFPIVLFVLIYNIYSLAMGFSQTVGQKIFKTKTKYNREMNIGFIVKRSMLELVSIPMIGIPYLMQMDAELLKNKVIRA